jgi:hypothetical protein
MVRIFSVEHGSNIFRFNGEFRTRRKKPEQTQQRKSELILYRFTRIHVSNGIPPARLCYIRVSFAGVLSSAPRDNFSFLFTQHFKV